MARALLFTVISKKSRIAVPAYKILMFLENDCGSYLSHYKMAIAHWPRGYWERMDSCE